MEIVGDFHSGAKKRSVLPSQWDLEIIILPTPGEAKAKAMPGRLYIHTKTIIIIT